jgi:hypothetical protein
VNSYLISAIISEVTGSPALDYAQENLFDPLGITTATWLSSPEGISLGWMGLRITTRDFAKLGYLYLSEGMWDGQQILPADFIHEAMTGQIDTGWPDYQYGYQLWSTISTGSSVAIGMGGQYLFLVPSSDLVVVLTEGGYPCEVFPMTQSYPFGYQIAGFPVVEEALPANAAAFEVLQQAISRFETPLTVEVPPLPDMVQQISGLTYNLMRPPLFTHWMDSWTIESNLDTKAVQLTFDESSEATLSVVWANDEIWNVPVGLDGIYRVSSSPMGQVGVKGFWLTEDTFRVYVKIIGEIALFQLDFHFKPSIVQITSVEVARATSSVIAGLQQE